MSIIRVCPEHMCRMFNDNRIWERAKAGEFDYRIDARPKKIPFTHYNGSVSVAIEVLTVWDPKRSIGDPLRDIASEVNRHMDANNNPIGLWDPAKGELQIDGKIYRRFRTTGGRTPKCALCEGGDFIPPEERFVDSTYRPSRADVRLES